MQATEIKYQDCAEIRNRSSKNQIANSIIFLVSNYPAYADIIKEAFEYILKEREQKPDYVLDAINGYAQEKTEGLVKVSLCKQAYNDENSPLVCFQKYNRIPSHLKLKIVVPPEENEGKPEDKEEKRGMYAKIIRDSLERILSHSYFDQNRIEDVKSAVDEAYSNAIKYGPKNMNVEFAYLEFPDRIKVNITNYGGEFIAYPEFLKIGECKQIEAEPEPPAENDKFEKPDETKPGNNAIKPDEAEIEKFLTEYEKNGSNSAHKGLQMMRYLADGVSIRTNPRKSTTTVSLEFCLNGSKQAA